MLLRTRAVDERGVEVTKAASAYPASFYQKLLTSKPSAMRVIASILTVVEPRSVVDVGCGIGLFLSVFREFGVDDVHGIDLPPPDRSLLQIPQDRFTAHDLNQPYLPPRQFDLVMSLETAEHLPPSSAGAFVETLTNLGPVVVFSAAIPKQGGYEHRNERWQDWWAQLFDARGYRAIDFIRDALWNDTDVALYYRQNIVMYATNQAIADNPKLRAAHERTQRNSLARVHPEKYMAAAEPREATARFVLSALPYLPRALYRAISRRVAR